MTAARRIEDDLVKYIQSQALGGGPVAGNTDLLDEGILDSLLLMDLVLYVETTYQILLDEADISPQHFRTIRTLAELVQRKRPVGHRTPAEPEAADRPHNNHSVPDKTRGLIKPPLISE